MDEEGEEQKAQPMDEEGEEQKAQPSEEELKGLNSIFFHLASWLLSFEIVIRLVRMSRVNSSRGKLKRAGQQLTVVVQGSLMDLGLLQH